MPRGGKRPNAGRKKTEAGVYRAASKELRAQAVLTKEAARAYICQLVYAELGPLILAQVANAKGLKYLVTRDKKTGKFVRVTEAMAKAKQDAEDAEHEETIEVWEKDPSVQAFTDLMNRVVDRPAEQPQQLKVQHQFLLEDLVVGVPPPVGLLEA